MVRPGNALRSLTSSKAKKVSLLVGRLDSHYRGCPDDRDPETFSGADRQDLRVAEAEAVRSYSYSSAIENPVGPQHPQSRALVGVVSSPVCDEVDHALIEKNRRSNLHRSFNGQKNDGRR